MYGREKAVDYTTLVISYICLILLNSSFSDISTRNKEITIVEIDLTKSTLVLKKFCADLFLK